MVLLRIIVPAALTLALAGCAAAPEPPAACHVVDVGDLDVTFVNGVPVVPVSLDGHALHMLVDTGAEASVITPATARVLHIAQDEEVTASGTGVNGSVAAAVTLSQSLSFGRVNVGDESFLVAALGDDAAHPGAMAVDGLLGSDILRQFAIALDFPEHKMMLLQPGTCAEVLPPWLGRYSTLKFTRATSGSPIIPIRIDGQVFYTIVDTGDYATAINTPALDKAGVVPEAGSRNIQAQSYGLGGLSGDDRVLTFARVSIGAESFAHAPVQAMNSGFFAEERADGLLGEDYLRTHRVFIDNAADKIYLGINAP